MLVPLFLFQNCTNFFGRLSVKQFVQFFVQFTLAGREKVSVSFQNLFGGVTEAGGDGVKGGQFAVRLGNY